MENTGYIALSRQDVLRRQMQVIANNLANVNTPAFKGETLLFVEHTMNQDNSVANDLRSMSFVQDIATVRDLSEGPISATGNTLDLAISGKGYFVVQTDDGERYTRHGRFVLNGDGEIVTSSGNRVLSEDGQPMTLPVGSGSIEISRDGTVTASDPGDSASEIVLGRLRLVAFDSDYRLKREASGLLRADGESPKPVADPKVLQGMIEESNVKGIVEMTRMIETVRSYQSANRLISDEHERQRRAIQTLVGQAGQA